jgi:aminopeptidase N
VAHDEDSEALQWLAPAQTAGKQKPFLFTQGQAILTRTWIPLQDTPGNRITYEAEIRAPKGLVVRMAAKEVPPTQGADFGFAMEHPIPPYLIALACGDLQFREVSARCGVWAETPVVEKARAEFADTESMVAAAEKLFGPYRWGRYDVLVLPPSFPFGGMENPCLTFATPTVLAGDRSLVSLVAHELAHSWSGNLVTNATWSDFWLNEGFTVYFEHRIMEAVYGQERGAHGDADRPADAQEGARDAAREGPGAAHRPRRAQPRRRDDRGRLRQGRVVPRDRASASLGRERLDAVLTDWFDSHAFQSVTTRGPRGLPRPGAGPRATPSSRSGCR